jgi:nicotinate-nucleotide adenylyltransferase
MNVGLFFGSFNPVHIGHLAIAGYLAQFTELDSVWMVVSPHNPLKEKNSLLPDYHRLAMLTRAIENMPYLKASDVEFKLPQPSYTINTLAHLQEKYPAHRFSLILGSDNLQSFTKWKNPEFILDNYPILVYPRPGFDGGSLKNHPNVTFANGAPQMDVTSTFIRQAVKAKKDVCCFMPDAAWKYMSEMHFYEK